MTENLFKSIDQVQVIELMNEYLAQPVFDHMIPLTISRKYRFILDTVDNRGFIRYILRKQFAN